MLDALFSRIEDQAEALVDLTRDLVRIPTVNPPGEGYEPCAELLGSRLARSGFDVDYFRAEGEIGDSDRYPRTNVVCRRQGAGPGKTVHFNGHIDVVDAGMGWTVDPFGGAVRDGRIYGRGTCDMKAGIAASVIAVEAILAEGIAFDGALEISGTVDEESGGYGGVAYLARQGLFSKPRVDHVIIPEPLNVDRICVGHRGVWWAEIETFGRIAHGSMPFLGDCAIRHMGAFMQALENELMPSLASRRTAMPVVPDGAKAIDVEPSGDSRWSARAFRWPAEPKRAGPLPAAVGSAVPDRRRPWRGQSRGRGTAGRSGPNSRWLSVQNQ